MAFDITTSVNVWNETTGYPTPGINPTQFKVVFAKLGSLELFCNGITLPSITLGVAQQPTTFLDMKQVGEKLQYSQFTCKFILDSKLQNYKQIYQWMYDLSVQGLNKDNTSECSVILDAGELKFYNVFPIMIGPIEFDSQATDIQYPSCEVIFECDRYEVI